MVGGVICHVIENATKSTPATSGASSGLDATQWAAVSHVGPLARVLGAPGTGKTTVVVEHVLHACRTRGLDPSSCLVVAPSRVAATALRERITAALGATTVEPLARTPESLAFAVVRTHGQLVGGPEPHLLTGAEQDVILAELFAGHRAGQGADDRVGRAAPQWPAHLQQAQTTRGFRQQVRELLRRVAEHGVDADQLRELGAAYERPAWAAAADVLREYDEVVSLAHPGAHDPAGLVATAADLLGQHDELRRRICEGLRLLVVDDAQELSVAGARLVRALHEAGVPLLLVGDPDVGTQAFRGGSIDFLARGWSAKADGGVGAAVPAPTYVLTRSYRAGTTLLEAAARVRAHVGVSAGAAHGSAAPGPGVGPGEAGSAVFESAAHEARHIATTLRRAHLLEGLPWGRMAVIVRGGDRSATLRRALLAEGVPVGVPGAKVPLAQEPAVRPLLRLFAASLPGHATATLLPCDDVVDLLSSRLIGADPLSVRRIRRELRRAELAAGGTRSSDALLEAAVAAQRPDDERSTEPAVVPGRGITEPLARLRRTVDAGRRAAAAGGTSEEVLWAIWAAVGVSDGWRSHALRGGVSAARADRDLDAVCALFDAARRYGERLPGSHPAMFLEHLSAQEVAVDSLVAGSVGADEVTLTTPAGAVGREWHTVVVAGVQEGVWPDLRPRGSILQVSELVDVMTGCAELDSADRLRVTRQDEARLLLVAVSRASHRLLVTAVRDEQTQPSPYLDVIDPLPPAGPTGEEPHRSYTPALRPLTLPAAVAQLRRELGRRADADSRALLLAQLARLEQAGVASAEPSRWWAGRPVSDDRPVRTDDRQVAVSPSKVEAFTECGLRWLLTSCGGRSAHDAGSAAVGSLVHEIAAEVDNGDESALLAALDERWPRLSLGHGWLARRQFELARQMLTRLARYDADARSQGWEVVAKEIDATVDVGRATVRGRVDRLERDADGRLRVVDLKTGASKPTRAQVERLPQLGAYQVAIARGAFDGLGDSSGGAALLQLGKAAGAAVTLQTQQGLPVDDDPMWAESLVTQVAEGMAAATFEARAGDGCRRCPALDSCPLQTPAWQL